MPKTSRHSRHKFYYWKTLSIKRRQTFLWYQNTQDLGPELLISITESSTYLVHIYFQILLNLWERLKHKTNQESYFFVARMVFRCEFSRYVSIQTFSLSAKAIEFLFYLPMKEGIENINRYISLKFLIIYLFVLFKYNS